MSDDLVRFEITIKDRQTGETQHVDAGAYILSMIGEWRGDETWRGWSHIPERNHEKLTSYTNSIVADMVQAPSYWCNG